jgi:HD-like signal output (HDOD) protein
MDLPEFWRYNLLTASAARWLAGKAEVNSDLVFTVGLMHGIGQLQMHVAAPQAVLPLDKIVPVLDAGRAALEKQTLGFHNGEVSAELARIWNLPAPIVQALRQVPDPLAAPEFSPAAACVYLGSWAARHGLQQSGPEQQKASFPLTVATTLGLSWEQLEQEMPPVAELALGLDDLLG